MRGSDLYASVPADADLSYITENLRGLAVPIGCLLADPANARLHPDDNMETIRSSLTAYGQRVPLSANIRHGQPVVIAGNGRLEASRQLGRQYVAVAFEDDDAVTASGYALVDNRSAEQARWNVARLGPVLEALKAEGVKPEQVGFDPAALKDILGKVGPGPAQAGGQGIQIPGGGQTGGPQAEAVKFRKWTFPLTADEADMLTSRIEAHAARVGTLYGFFGLLLERD